ncbi:MAG: hypothetical protein ABJE66_04730 [Deltaproteobacteria bacterium]
MRWLALLLLVPWFVATAHADDEVPATHKGQLGLSLRLGLGVRGTATYNSDYCGVLDSTAKNGNAPVCSGREPFAIDIEPSFGVAKAVELVFGLHLGLENDFGPTAATDGPKAFRIEPGARFFFSESGHSKLFVQPALVVDFTNYLKPGGGSYGNDFGVRATEGYWLDLHRAFGFYVFVGETAEFSRWLSATLDFGIGFQGRYP